MLDAVLNHGNERIEIAMAVDDADGFAVLAELASDQDFKKLFICADASRKNEEAVAPLLKQAFSLAHGVHDDEFIASLVADFEIEKAFGDDADGFAAGFASGPRNLTHEADASAAGDQGDASPGQLPADNCRRRVKIRIQMRGA